MPTTILIVDDSATMRGAIRLFLRDAGWTLAEADSGTRALLLARLLKPAVVVSDVHLPDVDGVELTRRLRAGEAGTQPRVVLISGDTSPEWRERGAEAGAEGFVGKPVTPAVLRDTITRLLPEGTTA